MRPRALSEASARICCIERSESCMETYERALVITWLLKDFGWMTTNVYLAIPAGICSVVTHIILVFFDPRKNFLLYNISLSCWVTGNFLWMCTEFMYEHNNKEVHWGPETPIGDWNKANYKKITEVKLALFGMGVLFQLILYLLLWTRRIAMPVDFGEDIVALNEIKLLCRGRSSKGSGAGGSISYGSAANGLDEDHMDFDPEAGGLQGGGFFGGFTVAYVENFYIIFWCCKDIFWSWGTGDPPIGKKPPAALEGFIEAMGISFACVAICNYMLTAYIHRRNSSVLVDCLSAVCWIVANFVWMCGEFFVRFDNDMLDDDHQGNDYRTRIASAVFFLTGILLQIYLVAKLTRNRWSGRANEDLMRRPSGVYAASPLEVFAFAPVTNYTPQKLSSGRRRGNDFDDSDDVEMVMF